MCRLLLFSGAFFFALSFVFFTESKFETHSVFYVQPDDVYGTLKKDGAFGTSIAFYIIEQIPQLKKKITTGEYEIHKGENVISVVRKMLTGKKVQRKLTIPEGYTVKQVIEKLNENHMLFGNVEGNIPEGILAPNTYYYCFGDTKNSVLQKMKKQMVQVNEKLSPMNKTSLTFDEVVILASIIEKESSNVLEYPLISSVFHNRLAINMRLQSDPTVIYAMSDGYGKIERKLTRKDLLFQSPYNTYRNTGLPPSPICCPGEKAIYAAMFPAKTEYFYFVSNKEHSGHIFSKDYKQHLKEIQNLKKASIVRKQ